jgi:hypothetical protein
MVIWGIKDNDSWRQASSPLLYTAGLDRKPAWYAVRSALRHRVLSDTGIHDVQRDAPADDRYYDLHGRRLAHPRGLVIERTPEGQTRKLLYP